MHISRNQTGAIFAAALATTLPVAAQAADNVSRMPTPDVAKLCKENKAFIANNCVLPKAPVRHVVHHVPPHHVTEQAPPPPPPAPPAQQAAAAPPPPPPNGGLGYIIYDANQSIRLPSASIDVNLTKEERAFIDDSECNRGGLGEAIRHPLNAKCIENGITKQTTAVGILGVKDGRAVYVITQPVVATASMESRGTHGNGWLPSFIQLIGTVGNLIMQGEFLDIARQGLNATQNLDLSITNGIKNGSFTSLFGSMGGCANIANVGSTTGKNTATCVINSNVVDSGVGGDNVVRPNGTTSTTSLNFGQPQP